jgi:NTE family protein
MALAALAVPGADPQRPIALLDYSPLAGLLARTIHFPSIQHNIDVGALDALAITASNYRTGMSVSFCMGGPSLELWERSQRIGVRATIGVPHLLASSAIPFVGAASSGAHDPPDETAGPPTFAQIGSQVLSSVFTDALGTDLEKVRLVNIAVRQMPLRDIVLLVLTPSVPLETLVGEFRDRLPRALRVAIGGIGGTAAGGEGLLSYLLFDAGSCSALIELGYRDAQSKRDPLLKLLSQQ